MSKSQTQTNTENNTIQSKNNYYQKSKLATNQCILWMIIVAMDRSEFLYASCCCFLCFRREFAKILKVAGFG